MVMGKMNWTRVIVCGLLTGVVWTGQSAISTWFLGAGFNAAVGGKVFAPGAGLFVFLFTLSLLGGIWAMWLYAAIRPRYGPGAKTAVIAGFAWWFVSTLADWTWTSLGFVSVTVFLPLSLIALPELIVAALVGAWLYKEDSTGESDPTQIVGSDQR